MASFILVLSVFRRVASENVPLHAFVMFCVPSLLQENN